MVGATPNKVSIRYTGANCAPALRDASLWHEFAGLLRGRNLGISFPAPRVFEGPENLVK